MRKRRRRRKMLPVPVTSMGDIAFQLIIFFMLASNFMREANIRYERPTAPDIDRVEGGLSVVIDEDGAMFVQGLEVGGEQDIEARVTEWIADQEKDGGEAKRIVLLRCDKEIDHAVFGPVVEAITKAGGQPALVGEKRK